MISLSQVASISELYELNMRWLQALSTTQIALGSRSGWGHRQHHGQNWKCVSVIQVCVWRLFRLFSTMRMNFSVLLFHVLQIERTDFVLLLVTRLMQWLSRLFWWSWNLNILKLRWIVVFRDLKLFNSQICVHLLVSVLECSTEHEFVF